MLKRESNGERGGRESYALSLKNRRESYQEKKGGV